MRLYRGNDLNLGAISASSNIVLSHERRLEHLSIFGLTGTGKTRYVESLVRQDIRNWPDTKCGLLLIDRHGDLFDGIMQWVGANELRHLPIVPIDLSRTDQIIGYNVLRKRKAEPSVIIDSFVRAMSYVWGQEGTDQTPLFERWAINTLYRLYHEGKTLADAAHLFTRDGTLINGEIHDPLVRRDWLEARRNWKDFETDSRSTVNRFRRFLLNPMLRAMFGQGDTSLDFGKALEQGQIILVSLAQRGGVLSPENGDLVATLLLSDLWTGAAERGQGDVKPFYCVLDEFQRFLSPSLAENLAEARKFGIGLTMASQHPRQLLAAGQTGERIYDEVMENARSKVSFRLASRPNLQPVAEQMFMRTLDPFKVKYQHYQTALVGHEIRYLPSVGTTTSDTLGGGRSQSHTDGRSRETTDQWSHTDGVNDTVSETDGDDEGVSVGVSAGDSISVGRGSASAVSNQEGESSHHTDSSNWSDSEGEAIGDAVTDTDQWSNASASNKGRSERRSKSASKSLGFGRPTETFQDEFPYSKKEPVEKEADDEFQRKWAKSLVLTRGEAEDSGNSEQHSSTATQGGSRSNAKSRVANHNQSRGGATALGRGKSRLRGRTNSETTATSGTSSRQASLTLQQSHHHSQAVAHGTSSADTVGGSVSHGTNEADTIGENRNWSSARGRTANLAPHLIPVLGKEPSQPVFLTIEEQITIAMVKIARLPDRHAYILTSDIEEPMLIRTPDVRRPNLSATVRDLFVGWYQRSSGLAVESKAALKRIADRDATAFGSAIRAGDEVTANRRPIKSNGTNRLKTT